MDMVTTCLYGDLDTEILYESPNMTGYTLINVFSTTYHTFNQVEAFLVWFETIWTDVVQTPKQVLVQNGICKQRIVLMHVH